MADDWVSRESRHTLSNPAADTSEQNNCKASQEKGEHGFVSTN
jgi:hypothetical protein